MKYKELAMPALEAVKPPRRSAPARAAAGS
jgi:hypothetical protein